MDSGILNLLNKIIEYTAIIVEKVRVTYNFMRTFFPQKFYPRVRQPAHRAGKIFRAEKMLG